MNKVKAFLVILVSIILALSLAMLLNTKQEKITPNNLDTKLEENVILKEDKEEVMPIEKSADKKNESNLNSQIINYSNNKQAETVTKVETSVSVQDNEENIKVEQAGISFDDPGIINDNGTIIVTREFKLKSPTKYSFEGFGTLAKPPIR